MIFYNYANSSPDWMDIERPDEGESYDPIGVEETFNRPMVVSPDGVNQRMVIETDRINHALFPTYEAPRSPLRPVTPPNQSIQAQSNLSRRSV